MRQNEIKIIQLVKWQVPKTESIKYDKHSDYVALGYFDTIKIIDADKELTASHPLRSAYETSTKSITTDQNEKNSLQELVVFADNSREDDLYTRFGDIRDCLAVYMSMIHIDNEGNIDRIINRIEECFHGKEYVYYFSFDFSGIVLLAKNMSVSEYLDILFQLNYRVSDGDDQIRDSYSLVGLNLSNLQKLINENDENDMTQIDKDTLSIYGEFTAVTNFGVQDLEVCHNFLDEVDALGSDVKEYWMYGRHDLSIINDNANLEWLYEMQRLIDKFTNVDEYSSEKIFTTHETFIKASIDKVSSSSMKTAVSEEKSNTRDDYYNNCKNTLEAHCTRFRELNPDKYYSGKYIQPVFSAKSAILGIMRNQYAEDFVLCIYQSFISFLTYMNQKIEKAKQEEKTHLEITEFNETFRKYLGALNALVDSSMHAERQFIQATAYNAILNDVPVKIMAFYTAMLSQMEEIIRSDEDKKYTFLINPSFSDEISVEQISYANDKAPSDRILSISINEKSLYDPQSVLHIMGHEIAHYVGDNLRNRALRKKYMIRVVIYHILLHVIYPGFLKFDDLVELTHQLELIINDNGIFKELWKENAQNYSEELEEQLPFLVTEFIENHLIKEELLKYLRRGISSDIKQLTPNAWEYLKTVGGREANIIADETQRIGIPEDFTEFEWNILSKIIWDDLELSLYYVIKADKALFREKLIDQSMIFKYGTRVLENQSIIEYINSFQNVFSEAFSDVQMILMADLKCEDYVELIRNKFFEGWETRIENISRISTVFAALQFVGEWDANLMADQTDDHLSKLISSNIAVMFQLMSQEGKNNSDPDFMKYSRNCMCSKEEWIDKYYGMNEQDFVNGENENAIYSQYLNEHVFLYLLECIKKTKDQYASSREKQVKKADYIRKKQLICEFHNVREVFSEICKSNAQYKKDIIMADDHK